MLVVNYTVMSPRARWRLLLAVSVIGISVAAALPAAKWLVHSSTTRDSVALALAVPVAFLMGALKIGTT